MQGVPTGLFVGLSVLDVIQLVDFLPGANEKVVALDFMTAAGGPATNAAVAFAGLGGRAVLVTRMGDDPVGQLVVTELADCDVEVLSAGGCESTAIASIMITAGTGERAVVSASDRGRSRVAGGSDFGVGLVDRLKPDVVLVDSYEVDISLPIAREARAVGVPVLLDCGVKKEWTPNQLSCVDVAAVPSVYVLGGPQAIADDLRSDGIHFGAITDGADPIWWWADGASVTSELKVRSVAVVDTLGAGDFFHGALAYALAQDGLSGPSFEQALSFAATIAAMSVQSFGSRLWLERLTV